MYERELCEAIVKGTLHLAAGRTVTDLRVRIGGYPADPDQIARCFQATANGTAAEHADLQLVLDPPAVQCLSCGNEQAVGYALALLTCRQCGSFELETTGTQEVVLESITFDESTESRARTGPPPAPSPGAVHEIVTWRQAAGRSLR